MSYEAIIAIVERGKANAVVKKASEAGARGATIFFARGSGEQVFSFFRSLQVEPSKEIIMIIVPSEDKRKIYDVVAEAANVKEKGKGIMFTLPINDLSSQFLDEAGNGKDS